MRKPLWRTSPAYSIWGFKFGMNGCVARHYKEKKRFPYRIDVTIFYMAESIDGTWRQKTV